MSWLYYPSNAVTQASISDSDIHWTNDVVVNGEDRVYSLEYSNPADLKTLFSDVGGGLQTFSCFYRMSPVTLLGSLQLALKGNFENLQICWFICMYFPDFIVYRHDKDNCEL